MPVETIGLIVIAFVFLLMFLRIPISAAMAIPSIIAIYYMRGEKALFGVIESVVWDHSYNYILTTIPAFVLMGQILYSSGISEDLFYMFKKIFGRIRGSLAISTIAASAMFSAASGSSLATAGTMGVISSRQMLVSGYKKSLAGGSIAAGGTLGVLIPPSTIFIIYGMLAEQSIGKLLIAGIIPGIILMSLYILTVSVVVTINKDLAPTGERYSLKEKLTSLTSTIWILILFIIVIGGMYRGFFTPTEAAGVGAVGAIIIAIIKRKLTWSILQEALVNTLKTTGFIFAIIIGAFFLNYLLAITRIPMFLENFLTETSLSPLMILIIIIIMYILLGAVMDTMAMIVVTIPIVLPVVAALDYDLIWFGVLVAILVELALISPPVGMICFVLSGVAPDLKLEDIFKGVLFFIAPILIIVALLIMYPEIALYLPTNMR